MSKHISKSSLASALNRSATGELSHDNLRRLLRRFTKAQLLTDVLEICNLSETFSSMYHERRLDKNQLIDCIIGLMKQAEEDETDLMCLLALKYSQLHKSAVNWNAVKVKDPEIFVENSTVPQKFAKKLLKYLHRSQLFCKVKSDFYNDALWTLILVLKKTGQMEKVCLIMFANLPLIVHSAIKAVNQSVIIRSVVELFKGSGVDVLPLRSKNIETLLVYAKEQFQLPEDLVQMPERVFSENGSSVEEQLVRESVTDIDQEKEVEKRNNLLDAFGSHNEPAIELLKYNVVSQLEYSPRKLSIPDVSSRVIFKGSNILEGICEMVKRGAADYPVPSILLHSRIQEFGTEMHMKVLET